MSIKLEEQDLSKLSPMMQHYLQTKKEYPGCILFYRLGDFYEMFFEDAEIVSKELELTLTGKSCGLPERAPMCGVPYHAVDSYLTRLVERGYKAAICEQVEDPRTAKGMVKREVIRIVTPGTNLDMDSIEEGKNNFIFCILYSKQGKSGISVADVTTGEFYMTETEGDRKIYDEIVRYSPSEIICSDSFMLSGLDLRDLQDRLGIIINTLGAHYFDENATARILGEHFHVSSLIALGMDDKRAGSAAAGALLKYLYDTQKNSLSNITGINVYAAGKYMLLDSSTRRNLELTETMREKKKRGSLLWVLDRTGTAMGARKLHQMIEQPLVDKKLIEDRLDAVDRLCQNTVDRDEIREYLQPVYDLERLMTRVSYGSANPRDLIALRGSLRMFAPIRQVLEDFEGGLLEDLRNDMDDFGDLVDLLDRSIEDEPPLQVKEGGIIKAGSDADIDRLREAKTQGRQWLMNLEAEDQQRTGIKNLRIKYNKVFGYYFEVTNSFKNMVPSDYIRKQTLVGSERYTSEKLKSLEDTILNAEDKLNTLEYDKFCEIRDTVGGQISRIQKAARALAMLDVLCSLSLVAERGRYVRPVINEKGYIRIKEGHLQRHPARQQKECDRYHNRSEYGRKIHLHASGCAHLPDGADRKLCSRRFGGPVRRRQDLHESGSLR